MARERGGLEPRLTEAGECLEFFGGRAGVIARWLDDESKGSFPGCVDDETMRTVKFVEAQLRGISQACRRFAATTIDRGNLEFLERSEHEMLLELAEDLHRAGKRERAAPPQLMQLAFETMATYCWWNAIRRGERALLDGPPPLPWVLREMLECR